MKDAFEKLFRAGHQFKKLNVSDLIPGLSSSEFSVMGAILQMGENGKITSSELAAKTKTLTPAVSSTLRRLEEKGYEVRVILKGLGEFEGIRKIFAEHIEEAEM